jgi:dihydrolipoamide dehydrogenase
MNRAIIDWNERYPTGDIQPQKCGFLKMITTDDENKTLLGMRAMGVNSSSMIQTASLMIHHNESIRQLSDSGICNPHPSINEAVIECSRMLLGRSIYKPHVWPRSFVRHYSQKGDFEQTNINIIWSQII